MYFGGYSSSIRVGLKISGFIGLYQKKQEYKGWSVLSIKGNGNRDCGE